MPHKIYPAARRRIIEIWLYTDKAWGEAQADRYVRGLYEAIDEIASKKYMWRKIEHEDVTGIYFVRYKHHFVFFRELSPKKLGIVNVLHESMDIPNRLKEDFNEV